MNNILINRINQFSSYQIVNGILALFILLIFGYSALFSPEKSRHPIPSAHTLITGEASASTGLSRGFSSIMRGQFKEARDFNPYCMQVFLFFLVQLALRIFISTFYNSLLRKPGLKSLVTIDGLFSGGLLLILFEPFWREISLF